MREKSLPRAIASRAFARLGIRLYDLYYGERDLGMAVGSVVPAFPVEARPATREDLHAIVAHEGRSVEARFARNEALGSQCIVAVHEDAVAGYVWTNERVFEFLGAQVRELPEGCVHIHHAVVFPEHRGRKFFQELLSAIYRKGREEGRLRAVCLVDRADGPALAAFRRTGTRFRAAPILWLAGLRPVVLGANPLRARWR